MTTPDNNTKASLGCGSLILIAIIVLIFSNGKNDEMEVELRGARTSIKSLESEIEAQSDTLSRIEDELKKLRLEIKKTSE
jgi:septal ring factor EnvC (AmiA/AmiB activator)